MRESDTVESVGEPVDAFFFEWLNNGCTVTCGSCPGIAKPDVSRMLVGATIPIVELERPRRSSDALVDRTAVLVTLLQDRPPSSAQRAKLEEWAQAIVASNDITVTTLPGDHNP